MHRATRWAVSVIGTATMMSFTAACGSQVSAGRPNAPGALAVVNGQKLTVNDWKLAINGTDFLQRVTLATNKQAEKQQVQELASDMAVEQYALKKNWVTKGKAQQEAKAFVSGNVLRAFGGTAKTQTALKKQHLTIAGLTQFLTQQMVLEAAFAHAAKNVKAPTNAALQAYYNQHKSLFTSPSQDKMRMILVKRKSLAESLMKQLKSGASWTTLAAKYSLDPGSKKKGGEYGWVSTGPQSGFVTNFYQEMDKLKPGQYGIAHTQYGYHVIEVQATKPGTVQSFASVKQQLASSLMQQKQGSAFQSFTKKIAQEAKIKIDV